jgi:hypothetical protein
MKNNLFTYADITNNNNHYFERIRELDRRNRTMVIIEPSGAALGLVRHGVRKGYNIIVFVSDFQVPAGLEDIEPQIGLIVHVNLLDLANMQAVLHCINIDLKILAIIPGATPFVYLASKLTDVLKLPGLNINHVMKLTNKVLMYLTLERVSVSIPVYETVICMKDMEEAIEKIGFPAVIRKVDREGFELANNADEARAIAAQVFYPNSSSKEEVGQTLMYAQYIEGRNYILQGTTIKGKIRFFNFAANDDATNPPDAELTKQVQDWFSQALHAIQINNCVFHADICIDAENKFYLINISSAMPQNQLCSGWKVTDEYHYFDFVFHAYMGEPTYEDYRSIRRIVIG